MNRKDYIAQVELLLNCLPVLKEQSYFAVKGGTAINFFIRNLPRLSVDIDLTFTDMSLTRANAIQKIQEGLVKIDELIREKNSFYEVEQIKTKEGILAKLIIINQGTRIKIEPNFIMRGTLEPIQQGNLCQSIEDKFAYSIKDVPLLSTDELYAGKICAALSRQHPRDFYDIKVLFENEGLTKNICSAFVIYLACSPRPIHEILNPHLTPYKKIYENEFINMTEDPVSFESLMQTRQELITQIHEVLTENQRNFLLSIKEGNPIYELMPYSNVDKLPGLKWKLLNVNKMNKHKHKKMLENLRRTLNL